MDSDRWEPGTWPATPKPPIASDLSPVKFALSSFNTGLSAVSSYPSANGSPASSRAYRVEPVQRNHNVIAQGQHLNAKKLLCGRSPFQIPENLQLHVVRRQIRPLNRKHAQRLKVGGSDHLPQHLLRLKAQG